MTNLEQFVREVAHFVLQRDLEATSDVRDLFLTEADRESKARQFWLAAAAVSQSPSSSISQPTADELRGVATGQELIDLLSASWRDGARSESPDDFDDRWGAI